MKLLRQANDVPPELKSRRGDDWQFRWRPPRPRADRRAVLAHAARLGGPALVFTFDPHPVRLLRPAEAPPPLTWTDRKAQLLARLGIDGVIAYPTDEELLRLTPQEFFDRIVRHQLDARAMVEGPNFYFGRDRAGTIDVLGQLCRQADIELDVVEPLVFDGDFVSSSRIRRLIGQGQVDVVRGMLTEPYRIRGMVVHGAGRGAKLGFGTANLDAIDTLLPGPGVYAGRGFGARLACRPQSTSAPARPSAI